MGIQIKATNPLLTERPKLSSSRIRNSTPTFDQWPRARYQGSLGLDATHFHCVSLNELGGSYGVKDGSSRTNAHVR
jgi:hypothetical protein